MQEHAEIVLAFKEYGGYAMLAALLIVRDTFAQFLLNRRFERKETEYQTTIRELTQRQIDADLRVADANMKLAEALGRQISLIDVLVRRG